MEIMKTRLNEWEGMVFLNVIGRLQDLCKQNGKGLKIFKEENYYAVELFSNKSSEKILSIMMKNPEITIRELSENLSLSTRPSKKTYLNCKMKEELKELVLQKGAIGK